jgi:hypothetical protein
VNLTFDQYLGIAGLVVGFVGVLFGIIAVVYAVKLDQKLKTAQEAERQIERKFMHYMAAQEFEELAEQASEIMGNIRRREWAMATDSADKIGPSLGQVRGGRNRLLLPLEKDRLDVAATNVQRFIDSLPLAGGEAGLTEEQIQAMVLLCRPLVDIASEIAGRFRVESIQQSEEKK